MEQDYYKILEISRNATQQQIKKAFRKLAVKWHPDKNPNNKVKAEQKFKEIGAAYAVLTDPQKKEMYDRYGTSKTRQQHPNQQFTFTNEEIEEIFRQFFEDNYAETDDDNDDDNTEWNEDRFIFEHLFGHSPIKKLKTSDAIKTKPFKFSSKYIYYVEKDNNYNQKISSYLNKNPFEKSNREYGREILENIKYLLESLPIQKRSFSNSNNFGEYYLLLGIINTSSKYVYTTECIDLAKRLYNLRNHIIHWKQNRKSMSFKSLDHYFNVSKQFIIELSKQEQFKLYYLNKHFKVTSLNINILHEQFISHKSKNREQRKKYGDLRKSLNKSYGSYENIISTRTKWFIAGMLTTVSVIVYLVRNIDFSDDIDYDRQRR